MPHAIGAPARSTAPSESGMASASSEPSTAAAPSNRNDMLIGRSPTFAPAM